MGLLMLCTLVFAQEIPRGVSQIVIANHNAASLNMKHVSSVLSAGKYAIEFNDDETGVITSGLITVDKTAFKIRLNAYCMNNKIIITGLIYTSAGSQNGNEELIVNRGANDSPYLLGFNKMHSIAAKLEGKKSYK